MNFPVLIGRVVHVGLGVFWAGTVFFMVFLLEPSVRSVGPEGGRVMQALQNRGLLTIMPVAAVLTILSGGYLYGRMLSGFGVEWITTPFGESLTVGAVASLVAFAQGLFFMRPATLEVGKLSARLGQTSEPSEREGLVARIADLKARSRNHARWIALWLAVAVFTMATGRFL